MPTLSEPTQPRFKSPTHKLVKFFFKSRGQWRKKASERLATIRKLAKEVNFLQASLAYWQKRAREAEESHRQTGAVQNRGEPVLSQMPAVSTAMGSKKKRTPAT
jgi:hypothetical protein